MQASWLLGGEWPVLAWCRQNLDQAHEIGLACSADAVSPLDIPIELSCQAP